MMNEEFNQEEPTTSSPAPTQTPTQTEEPYPESAPDSSSGLDKMPETEGDNNNDSNEDDDDEHTSRCHAGKLLLIGSLVIAAIVAAVVLAIALTGNNDDNAAPSTTTTSNTPQQQQQPDAPIIMITSAVERLSYLRTSMAQDAVMKQYTDLIPENLADLSGKSTDTDQDPMIRAASWFVEDSFAEQPSLLRRFALANIYFSTMGGNWTNSTNWLSANSHCEWHGVICCSQLWYAPTCGGNETDPKEIVELDLYQNNLVGTIPDAMAFLTDLRSIYLSKNVLSGTIPGQAISVLPKLMKLYMAHNQLQGTIPVEIFNYQQLDTLFLQGNNLNGSWPEEFCYTGTAISYFGVDCEEVYCSDMCCRAFQNCYYDG